MSIKLYLFLKAGLARTRLVQILRGLARLGSKFPPLVVHNCHMLFALCIQQKMMGGKFNLKCCAELQEDFATQLPV